MDDKSSISNVDCPSILKVACPPPGHGEKSGNFSENNFTTYIVSTVALKGAGIDLDICTRRGINSSTLEVACGPQGQRKIRKVLQTITHLFTSPALFVSKVE
jgi:hypothetical protein